MRGHGRGSENVFECRGLGLEIPHRGTTRTIVKDLSLDVRRGEFFSIVGASGTGKTSLVRLLGGLMRATCGSLVCHGVTVDGPPPDVVVVFQDYSRALLQWRCVAANVALGLEGRVSAGETERRVTEALQLVGLDGHGRDYPWQLSGGMQQRVQIARALALRPQVLLMDEPFAALDAMTKASLQDEMLRIHDRTGASFVFITHDIEEAIYLGDRVAVLGGPPGQIYTTVPIDLPRPREQVATRQMPTFLAYRAQIHAAIGDARSG